MDNKTLKKIRNQMIDDGFTEYGMDGIVCDESRSIWNAEFARRKALYEKSNKAAQ